MTIPINQSQIARTTAQWQSLNPILALDTIGIEVMTNGYNRYKRGDGVTRWNSLAYIDKVYNADIAVDAVPTDGSGNPVASNGVYDALGSKQDATNGLTAETNLDDSDTMPFYDASASGPRKTLWSNIKSKLKTYFDTIYAAVSHTHSYLPLAGGTLTGHVYANNGVGVYAKNTNGSNMPVIGSNAFNNVVFGDKNYYSVVMGSTMDERAGSGGYILTSDAAITLLSQNYGIRVNYNGGSPIVVPMNGTSGVNNAIGLGNTSYRFTSVYLVSSPNVSSDERMKRDIADVDNDTAAAFISALKIVSYRYKDDNDSQKQRIGIIAQDLFNIDSDFAAYFVDDDGSDEHYLSLRPSDLIFPLIQTVQKQQTEIDDLKTQLAELKTEIAAMKG